MHDHLRSKLCDLYENDCIFDKFECTFSGNGEHVLTGSYNNYFHIYDREATSDVVLQADKSAFKKTKTGASKGSKGLAGKGAAAKGANGKPAIDVDSIDFNKKILHASYHPRENIIAIAATNNVSLEPGQADALSSSCTRSRRHEHNARTCTWRRCPLSLQSITRPLIDCVSSLRLVSSLSDRRRQGRRSPFSPRHALCSVFTQYLQRSIQLGYRLVGVEARLLVAREIGRKVEYRRPMLSCSTSDH